MKTIAVTGATSQLGQALQKVIDTKEKNSWVFWSKAQLDINNQALVEEQITALKPQVIINLAAFTAVDQAESEVNQAEQLNTLAVGNLAAVCQKVGAVFIHMSTDFVFDGKSKVPYRETDPPLPINRYGQSKLKGEQAALLSCKKTIILRTSWVYSSFGHNFYNTMLSFANQGKKIAVVNDQVGSPTHAADVARAIYTVASSDKAKYGVYHFANKGETTWYHFAQHIFKSHRLTPQLSPISSASFNAPAKRPAYSVLDTAKFSETFGLQIRTWQEAFQQEVG